MKLSRQQFWLLLQGIILFCFLAYEAVWLTAKPVTGTVVGIHHERVGKRGAVKSIEIMYVADDRIFTKYVLWDEDVNHFKSGERLPMHYLPFARSLARIDGISGGTIIKLFIYGILLLVSAGIFLMPNFMLAKQSSFIITSRPPFIRYVVEKSRTWNETIKAQ